MSGKKKDMLVPYVSRKALGDTFIPGTGSSASSKPKASYLKMKQQAEQARIDRELRQREDDMRIQRDLEQKERERQAKEATEREIKEATERIQREAEAKKKAEEEKEAKDKEAEKNKNMKILHHFLHRIQPHTHLEIPAHLNPKKKNTIPWKKVLVVSCREQQHRLHQWEEAYLDWRTKVQDYCTDYLERSFPREFKEKDEDDDGDNKKEDTGERKERMEDQPGSTIVYDESQRKKDWEACHAAGSAARSAMLQLKNVVCITFDIASLSIESTIGNAQRLLKNLDHPWSVFYSDKQDTWKRRANGDIYEEYKYDKTKFDRMESTNGKAIYSNSKNICMTVRHIVPVTIERECGYWGLEDRIVASGFKKLEDIIYNGGGKAWEYEVELKQYIHSSSSDEGIHWRIPRESSSNTSSSSSSNIPPVSV